MNNCKVYIILFTLLSTACASKQVVDNSQCEKIVFGQNASDEFLSDLELEFYQPEETDSSLVGSISIICDDGEELYIRDDRDYKLMKYDKDGKFLGTIGSRGQGAGEYVSFSYYFLDKENNMIGVLDEDQKKLLYYGLGDGVFLKSESYPNVLSNCCVPYGTGLLWYNQNYNGELSDKYFVVTDSTGNTTDGMIEKEFVSGYFTGSSCPLFVCDDKIYGFTPYDMKLYEFADSGASVKYDISIDGFHTPSIEYLNKISDGGRSFTIFSELEKSEYISYYSIYMCRSLMVIKLICNGEKYIGVLNRLNGTTLFMGNDEFSEKLGVGKISYFVQNSIDDSIVGVIEKDVLEEYAQQAGSHLDSRLKEIMMDKNDNPIIVKIKYSRI